MSSVLKSFSHFQTVFTDTVKVFFSSLDGRFPFFLWMNNWPQEWYDMIFSALVADQMILLSQGLFNSVKIPHTARHTQNILHIHNINVLQWPARSPDLSPIEHLWDHLGCQVRERQDVNNIRDLEHALQAEWVRTLLQVIRKLICSMRCRCLLILAVNGGHTRY